MASIPFAALRARVHELISTLTSTVPRPGRIPLYGPSGELPASNVPSGDTGDALAGTVGTPSAANPFVTDSDPRMTDARTPLSHVATHQNGGADQLDVTGLTGLLASPQIPAAHTHAPDIPTMTLIGPLDVPALPVTRIGQELAPRPMTLIQFFARRMTAGSSGTTTIQLEIDGAPVAGAVLSWTPADADGAMKSVTVSEAVADKGIISFRLVASEAGAADILAGVKA